MHERANAGCSPLQDARMIYVLCAIGAFKYIDELSVVATGKVKVGLTFIFVFGWD